MQRDVPFDVWYAEAKREQEALAKAPTRGGIVTPLAMPRPAAYGPPMGVPSKPATAGGSKYNSETRSQPQPWIDDVSESTWFSPSQPVWPFGPPQVDRPLTWDYPVGYNLNYIPARMETMAMLSGMARTWGVLATIIATRMDQLLRIPWTIQKKGAPGASSVGIDAMKKFLRHPDGKSTYSQWSRKLLDDLLVLDAPTIYFARDRLGRPLTAEVLPGRTIFPLIDEVGRRPDSVIQLTGDGIEYLHRQPAFQQIIKGQPLVDLDESEIMYQPMRPRPDMPMFGYPPTEQILVESSEAIRKTFYQLNFWAEGTIPDLIVTVPDNWTPTQIAMFQAHFDAFMSGNLQLKSKVRFLPGGMKPFDIKNSSGESLWSQRDETLIRLACYAYNVSPTPFVKMLNRSTAQSAQQTSVEEGLHPLMAFWKDDIMDEIIQGRFQMDDLEFIWLPIPDANPERQSKTHQIQVKEGLRSRNEVRRELGLQAIEGGDVLTIELGNAIVPVSEAAKGDASISAQKPEPAPVVTPRVNPSLVRKLSSTEVDNAAASADGSVHSHSHARLSAGNYRKGHIRLHGLDISIENAYGTERGKKRKDGSLKWSATMSAHYGYIRGTVGADGDQMDVYVGRRPELDQVFVLDQAKLTRKGVRKFDEHKVMLGYRTLKRALRDYASTHDAGTNLIDSVTQLSVSEFKKWLKSGRTKKPLAGKFGQLVASTPSVAKADTISASTGLSFDYGRPRKKRKRRLVRKSPAWLMRRNLTLIAT